MNGRRAGHGFSTGCCWTSTLPFNPRTSICIYFITNHVWTANWQWLFRVLKNDNWNNNEICYINYFCSILLLKYFFVLKLRKVRKTIWSTFKYIFATQWIVSVSKLFALNSFQILLFNCNGLENNNLYA